MERIKFEVGRMYYDDYGKLHECTKRTERSVWFGRYRLLIHCGKDVEYTNGALKISADNYNDIEIQRDKALNELLVVVNKVCEDDSWDYIYENEEEIYSLCKDLKKYLEEYTANKVRLEEN